MLRLTTLMLKFVIYVLFLPKMVDRLNPLMEYRYLKYNIVYDSCFLPIKELLI